MLSLHASVGHEGLSMARLHRPSGSRTLVQHRRPRLLPCFDHCLASITASLGVLPCLGCRPRARPHLILSDPPNGSGAVLVLSRKNGDAIIIGDDVVVTILEVRRGQVRLGIEAPQHVPIRRDEIPRLAQELPGAPLTIGCGVDAG